MACSICEHPRVNEIHAFYLKTGKTNATAAAFEIPTTTWKRHVQLGHVPPPPAPTPPPDPPIVEAEIVDDDADRIRRKPGAPCGVCALSRDVRRAVEQDIIEATLTYDAICKKHSLGIERRSIRHHQDKCIPHLVRDMREQDAVLIVASVRGRAESLMDKAEGLVKKALGLIDGAEDEDADIRERALCVNASANAINTARALVETLGKLTGELGPDVQINLLGSPQWQAVQDLLWHHFGTHPAFGAFVSDLKQMDAAPVPLQLTS